MPDNSRVKRAFAYLRVSGKEQITGDGFPRQREAIKKHAAAQGLRIVRWFEKSISGDLEKRPALDEMLAALAADGVQVIVVEKLDRGSRLPVDGAGETDRDPAEGRLRTAVHS